MNLRGRGAVSSGTGRATERARTGGRPLADDRDRPSGELEAASDAELIRRFRDDDLAAFEVFFERHRSLIYRTACGMTGDRGAAEEVLQDTFLRAYRHRGSLREDISPVPWLHRVALNLCFTRLGRRRLDAGPIDDSGASELRDGALEPSEWAVREELRQAIREGVLALPPKHRAVIVLYYLDGLSLQETATALGIRLGTVKSRIHYALHALRVTLEPARRGSAGAGTSPARPLAFAPAARDPER